VTRSLISQIVLAATCIAASLSSSADDELEDLLQARWFEIEIIVFERLPLLDINSEEILTYTTPRSWPSNLMPGGELDNDLDTLRTVLATQDPADFDPLVWESEFCLGYPLLEREDPIHPLLQPAEEAFDGVALDEAYLENETEPALLDDFSQQASELEITDQESQRIDVTSLLEPELLPETELEPTVTAYDQLLADLTAYEDEMRRTSYTWLPDLAMEAEVKALNRNRHLRPVIHRRWRAAVPERDDPQPIYLSSEVGPSSPLTQHGFAKIEGYATVTVGRYLHFAPTLWYHADNLGISPLAVPSFALSGLSTAPGYMQLKESRRMRSTELHYLDHPKFGVIVRIDPVTLPEDLQAVFSALAEPGDDPL